VHIAEQANWLEKPVTQAVIAAGAELAPLEWAEAVVWGFGPAVQLADTLARAPNVSWVQLPAAGVEAYTAVIDRERLWTSAKGAYSEPVAEHALALLLAGFRQLPRRARARSWQGKGGQTLFDASVVILGGGGIATTLLELLRPFRANVTVVRKHPQAMAGATAVVPDETLADAVVGVDAVMLAAALTPETKGMIGARLIRAMGPSCWLVNVARGALVHTPDLIRGLREDWLGGAALDVVDPEPLPADSPLWRLANCLITPHTANPPETEARYLGRRLEANVRARIGGRPLAGVVDPDLG